MAYKVEFSGIAARQFRKLDNNTARRIKSKIDELAIDPHNALGVKALKGQLKGIFRVRSGDFRILYQVLDEIITVFIVEIGNRKDIYD